VLNVAPRRKNIWGVEVQLHGFLTSVLDGDNAPTALSAGNPLDKRLGGPQNCDKENNLRPHWNPSSSVIQAVA
jgi:hypothetical protein